MIYLIRPDLLADLGEPLEVYIRRGLEDSEPQVAVAGRAGGVVEVGREGDVEPMSLRGLVHFFFQAEDGIRDKLVTGVQTCALPIFVRCTRLGGNRRGSRASRRLGPGYLPCVEFNLADLWEKVVDTVPEREALLCADRRLTYEEVDQRANQLAHALAARGVGAGDHIALYLYNGTEYLEAMFAAYKLRAVPVNVNYRYV